MSIRHDLGRFALVPEYIVNGASPPAQKLWCILWIYTGNGQHEAWPTLGRLATDMGVTRRTVQRILDDLIDLGAVTILHRTGTSSLYTLRWRPTRKVDTNVTTPHDTHVVTPTTPMSHRNRQNEIENHPSVQSDTNVHVREPGDARLTREEIRQIRRQAADIERSARGT